MLSHVRFSSVALGLVLFGGGADHVESLGALEARSSTFGGMHQEAETEYDSHHQDQVSRRPGRSNEGSKIQHT